MNLQQLEYILAIDTYRHFNKAAQACFVTQATLSMMVKKLEDELGTAIFDRTKQPVVPTATGKLIVEQARVVLKEVKSLSQIAKSPALAEGELRIGIIPTLAPYLLPLFLPKFLKKYPLIKLKITEQTTEQLLKKLAADNIDVALLATPLQENGFTETPLFYEEFKIFVSGREKKLSKKYILPKEIDVNRLWLLEEGHCLRSQSLNLCELQKRQAQVHHLDYEAGSIESLLKIVEMNEGITIVPELATIGFTPKLKKQLREFRPPVPVREISLVTYRYFIKKHLLDLLQSEIKVNMERQLHQTQKHEIIPV